MSAVHERASTPSTNDQPVLIVTATKVETQAVLDIFSEAAGKNWSRTASRNLTYYNLGIHGGVPVWLVQSAMGTATRGGALLTVRQAIQDIAPQAVILCGIAFGIDSTKQKLGELLISKYIEYYEPQKIDLSKGRLQRGERVGASERLLDRFSSADVDWKGAKPHFGLVMSGEKLVNDPEFLAWLREVEPEAIGGEMEAAGLYAAASDAKVDWIMVKAICDWGDGSKNSKSQGRAAKNAALFVLHVLEQGGLSESSFTNINPHTGEIQERILEAAIEKEIAVGKAAQLFILIKRIGGKSILDVVRSTIDDEFIIDETNLKSRSVQIEFPKIYNEVFPAEIILRINAPDFFVNTREKRILIPPAADGEVATFMVTPKKTGTLIINIEVLKGINSIATRAIRTKAFEIVDLIKPDVLTIPLVIFVQNQSTGMRTKFEKDQRDEHLKANPPKVIVNVGGNLSGNLTIGDNNSSKIEQDGEKEGKESLTTSSGNEKLSEVSQSDQKSTDVLDAEERWLKAIGLKENPFRHQDAEDRDKYLPSYFTRSAELQWTNADLMNEKKIWFFGGDEGYGKTALRKFLAARGRPQKPDAEMICFEVNQDEFEHLVAQLDEASEFKNLFFRKMFAKCLHIFPGESLNKLTSGHSQGDMLKNIAVLSEWLQEHGVSWVLCLVDPSRESFAWKGSHVSTIDLLEPLINFPELGGVRFRFFLPTSVKDVLEKKFPPTTKNQHRYRQLQWDDPSLVKLLANRMTTLSVDQTVPLRSLGQICEKDLNRLVDAEIASLAQGSPRAVIWLANRLIELHCQAPQPSPLISLQEWDQVKLAWWNEGERQTLGSSKPQKLRVLDGRIFYRNHEIVMGGRSNQLLCCLVSARDGFRENDELIKAGWSGENPSGITEKAFSEAVRRMKNELIGQLNKYGVDVSGSKWVKSVRNRGYQLEYPGIAATEREGK